MVIVFRPQGMGPKQAQLVGTCVGETGSCTFFGEQYSGTSLDLKVERISTISFISTDSLQVKASGVEPGATVLISVQGRLAATGVVSFERVPVTANAAGEAAFEFIPASNASFVGDRQRRFTGGSTSPNSPISFDVLAEYEVPNSTSMFAALSDSHSEFVQDGLDCLRQEYVDYGLGSLDRGSFVAQARSSTGYNQGNYNFMLDGNLRGADASIRAYYQNERVTVQGRTFPLRGATLTRSSGFRSPQRNNSVGGQPTSKHIFGRALDYQVDPFRVVINGQTVSVPKRQLWDALVRAGRALRITTVDETNRPGHGAHIHFQW